MTILNTTFAIDPSLLDQSLEWVARVYRNAAEKTAGTSPRNSLLRIHTPGDSHTQEEAVCYALQICFDSMESVSRWYQTTGARLNKVIADRWEGRVIPFTTFLEVIE